MGERVSFDYIARLYELETSEEGGQAGLRQASTVSKLSPAHIDPNNFQKMNVRYYVQV